MQAGSATVHISLYEAENVSQLQHNAHSLNLSSHLIASFYSFLSPKKKKKNGTKEVTRILEHAAVITGTTQIHLSKLYSRAVERKAVCNTEDPSPLVSATPFRQ